LTLPYQPLSELAGSLSAADLHVVAMGDPFVGIIHPCKIYNILSIGIPILYIGPSQSHATEIIERGDVEACLARHGDVDTVARYIAERATAGRNESANVAPTAIARTFSKRLLAPRLIETLEAISGLPTADAPAVTDPDARLVSAPQSSGES